MTSAWRSAGRRATASPTTGQQGFTLLEILLAAVIAGIAIMGLTLMLSRGLEHVVAQGDDRVALYLARQKIEKLTGAGFAGLLTGDKVNDAGCPNPPDPNNAAERCYNETNLAGSGQQTTGGPTSLDQQTFRRVTCVRNVNDDNPSLPADTLDPATWTCPNCALGGTCTGSTRRIKVAVTPGMMQADAVTVESVLVDAGLSTTTTTTGTTTSTTTTTSP
jgi:prepilin-type N-terminal cleavage/methylation domain-containing protein